MTEPRQPGRPSAFVIVEYEALMRDQPDVWDDPRRLGFYVQIKAAAEIAWPTLVRVPSKRECPYWYEFLSAGLVIEAGRRYTIPGLDLRRQAASDKAKRAADARWGDARSNARSNAPAMPDIEVEVEVEGRTSPNGSTEALAREASTEASTGDWVQPPVAVDPR